MKQRFPTMVEALAHRAAARPNHGFTFLDGDEAQTVSFASLHQRAQAIAAVLHDRGLRDQRVLLMYPPGLDFIAAFFGCLYARAVAVPVYPPDPVRLERSLPRLEVIARDAHAAAVLTTRFVLELSTQVLPLAPALEPLTWLATDDVELSAAALFREPAPGADTLAFVQYTSGSTASPKGVMVTHRNLVHNQVQIEAAFNRTADSVSVCWLPLFHDMGLIGNVLQPVYTGADSFLLSPLAFLQRPVRWLKAISEHRAHTSGGPNFAYELCLKKVTAEERAALDLSCWKIAYNGAEPVRADTLERFSALFGPHGFDRRAFYPCYGLAEATLFVSGGKHDVEPEVLRVSADGLVAGEARAPHPGEHARALVSCGTVWAGQTVSIVSRETRQAVPDGQVGEIWVQGDSIAQGYWGQPEASRDVFAARLEGRGDGGWLRTGDLGFVRDGLLYVTGRQKDVIILRGRNVYPQDLEWTVEHAHPQIRRGCIAAFPIEVGGEEQAAVVAEVDEREGPVDVGAIVTAVRSAVLDAHGVKLHAVVLVKAGTISKTSSGKIQRHASRAAYLNGSLDDVGRWANVAPSHTAGGGRAHEATLLRLRALVRRVADNPSLEVPDDLTLERAGLESLVLVELKQQLEREFDITLPLSVVLESVTLVDLAALVDETRSSVPRNETPSPAVDPWSTFVNPHVARLLEAFALDKRYERGEGSFVFDAAGQRYLDFTAAYGALPFGFNPPDIWSAVAEVAQARPASLVQPSLLDGAGRLAERLIGLAPEGLRYVTFANSGAEATEAAIKLARAATGRMGIVSMELGFHGKTLGALSATGRTSSQTVFGAPVPGFRRVPYGDLRALTALLETDGKDIAAVLVEPIQGEGGIHVAPPGYLRGVRDLCTRFGALLVVDEVQTGLGRTGTLFACENDGVAPDIMTLAKALGGGVVPSAAVLCTAAAMTEAFATRHSSTFAGNALAAFVGLRVLDLLTADNRALIRHVADTGRYLLDGLQALQQRYPNIVREVRGRGFMLGVELTQDHTAFARPGLLSAMAVQRTLGYAVCSHLLNVEGVRLAPTLLGSNVLRVEPPLTATRDECTQFLGALGRTLAVVAACDSEGLVGHLVGRRRSPRSLPALPIQGEQKTASTKARWSFVLHPLDVSSYRDFDAGLAGFSTDELQRLSDRLNEATLPDTPQALVLGSSTVQSVAGPSASGEVIAVPATTSELLAMPSSQAVALVNDAVSLARARGAAIVGLGAYTSIVSKNGAYLEGAGVALTTGNSFTVVAAVEVMQQVSARLGLDLPSQTVAIVGATGSIGRSMAMELANECRRLVLIGNPAHATQALERLRVVAEAVVMQARGASAARAGTVADACRHLTGSAAEVVSQLMQTERLALTVDAPRALRGAQVVVAATSSPSTLITAGDLDAGAIVCDVSRPANVSPGLAEARPDVLVVDGGVIALPAGHTMNAGYGLAPGLVYACMAETMLLALEGRFEHCSVGGDLKAEVIAELRRLSVHHGFRVVPAFDGRLLTDADWRRVETARMPVPAEPMRRDAGDAAVRH